MILIKSFRKYFSLHNDKQVTTILLIRKISSIEMTNYICVSKTIHCHLI